MRLGRDIGALVIFIALVFAVAWIASAVTLPAIPGWYAELSKPSFTPPNQVFGPVWSILYLMMAVAGWLVWRSRGPARNRALALFGVQLALNLAWSVLFFGLKLIGPALIEIFVLLAAISGTAVAAYRISRAAALLLVPYLAWVGYAAALNAAIWRLNS
jgi:tryptophan-rich sensory protein